MCQRAADLRQIAHWLARIVGVAADRAIHLLPFVLELQAR
jgi:hypothetical protein